VTPATAELPSQTNGFADGTQESGRAAPHFRAASIFTGIGGFDLGFENAGFDITFQCEIQEFCRTILEKRWPNLPRPKNIKELQASDIPSSDVWAGGFPCQDVSLARMGQRAGLNGKRSGLFYEFARLAGEARPRVLLLENVAGLLSSHGGRDFGTVIGTLAEFGYSVGWRVLNSKHFGVPQSRQRIYIVGCHRDMHGPGQILFEPERGDRDASARKPNGKTALSPFKTSLGDPSGDGPVVQSIAYCLYACSARHTGTDWSRTYVQYPRKGQVRRLTPKECEGVMSFPDGWTAPPPGNHREDELDSLRYHALGNAVTPPVAQWLATRIHDYLAAQRSIR
jgi:DNA (cytosine-5)-methyltransferase 1